MSKKSIIGKSQITYRYSSIKKVPQKNNPFRSLSISKVSKKLFPSSEIFKNIELKKSLGSIPIIILRNINTVTDGNNSNLSKFNNSGSITQISKKTNKSTKLKHNPNLNKSIPKIINKNKYELSAYNDEKYFRTTRPHKKVSFPKAYTTLKKYRLCHDTNKYNISNYICDYMRDYEKNSYKIKKLVNDSIYINKIKKDLISLKYGQKIKRLNEL